AASPAARRLALGALTGPVLFTAAWLLLGRLRPGYSQIRQPRRPGPRTTQSGPRRAAGMTARLAAVAAAHAWILSRRRTALLLLALLPLARIAPWRSRCCSVPVRRVAGP